MKRSMRCLARCSALIALGMPALMSCTSMNELTEDQPPSRLIDSSQEVSAAQDKLNKDLPNERVRHDLVAMYRRQDEAIKNNDFEAFIGTLAADYSIKLLNGSEFNRKQVEDFVKSDMARTRSVGESLSVIDDLQVENGEAVVLVTHQAIRVLDDAKGQPHKWENKVVHRETWTKTVRGWRIKRLEEVKQIYLLRDGKPLQE